MEKKEVEKDNKEGDWQRCNLKWEGLSRLTWKMVFEQRPEGGDDQAMWSRKQ